MASTLEKAIASYKEEIEKLADKLESVEQGSEEYAKLESELESKKSQLKLLQTLETEYPSDKEEREGLSNDVKKIIEKARKEEKDKQYAAQEKYKKEAQESKRLLEANDIKIKEMEEQLQKLTKSQKSEEDESKEKPEIAREVNDSISELKEQIKLLTEENVKTKEEFQETLKKRDLEAYRLKKIAESKGKIIPELVTGNSESEIDESFVVAMKRYEELQAEFLEQTNQTPEKEEKKSVLSDKSPISPDVTRFENKSLKDMTDDEYKKHREQIMANIKRAQEA